MNIYTPRNKKSPTFFIVILLFSSAILSPAAESAIGKDSALIRACLYSTTALCLSFGALLSIRFILTKFEYALYGAYDFPSCRFVVAKEFLSKKAVVFTLNTSYIKEIMKKKEYKRFKKKSKVLAVYDHRSDLFGSPCYIIFEDSDKLSVCVTDLGEDMYKLIKDGLKENEKKPRNPS
ncbi:MAG: hypothetical protein E7623_00530 [Ruminococcaceae bacterium]|nr:hypothetical protein [Oscillospiraceae bacterium]